MINGTHENCPLREWNALTAVLKRLAKQKAAPIGILPAEVIDLTSPDNQTIRQSWFAAAKGQNLVALTNELSVIAPKAFAGKDEVKAVLTGQQASCTGRQWLALETLFAVMAAEATEGQAKSPPIAKPPSLNHYTDKPTQQHKGLS